MNTTSLFIEALVIIIVVLLSLSVHEFAHAWVANLFGDPTARIMGRMTINPLRHWDRLGTTLLVALIFLSTFGLGLPIIGWGKPVPIDERNFTNPKWHGFQAAIAGPMSNFVFAVILAAIIRYFSLPLTSFWGAAISFAIYINIFLMFFNLLPVPPLDGSRILRLVLPEDTYQAIVSNSAISFGIIIVVFFYLITPIANWSSQLALFLMNR